MLAHSCIGWQKCGLKREMKQEFKRANYVDYLFSDESKNDLQAGRLKSENSFFMRYFQGLQGNVQKRKGEKMLCNFLIRFIDCCLNFHQCLLEKDFILVNKVIKITHKKQ